MKTFILLIIPFIIFASGETMSVSDSLYFNNADNQPFRQNHNQEARMHKLHKIDEQKAKSIIKELTQEESQYLKLTTRGNYLIYKASTEHYTLIINALDGTLIEKALK
ncbi:MAG: hypothetical protein PHO62_03670 [Sulfurimonas sp.]|uniref:hypothetical protein n=1 Tax=Sulfurimonas sp. TaxID=2022749 RepID=UPI0026036314|nr:hypothetical protein [Sulfurimonas sp.]MDD5372511.1 hypothetical protein [Sulfurimonas sp.]